MELPGNPEWQCISGHDDFLGRCFSLRSIMIGGFEDDTLFKHLSTRLVIRFLNGKPTIGGEKFYYPKYRSALTSHVSADLVQN
jgi:hypothetical protein